MSIENVKSTICSIDMGVPLGSNLGRLFFLVFITDFLKYYNILKFDLFADDTVYISPTKVYVNSIA